MLKSVWKTTLFLLLTCSLSRCDACCKQFQTHNMRGADCFNSSHERIPQCLRSDIEVILFSTMVMFKIIPIERLQVIDLSWNRIRKIVEDDLKRYKSLKILYLDENMIMNVDENAFTSMTSLEILDMSWNSFVKIPPKIFQLPSLRKLFFSYNQNTNILEDIERLKPITSPLQYLELAFDDLNELPDLGVLPTLFYFNITGNANVKFNSSKFAGICNLKALNNNDTTASFDDPCECWSLEKWLEGRGVEFQSFSCKAKIGKFLFLICVRGSIKSYQKHFLNLTQSHSDIGRL